jgi:hypothetical protein
MKVITHAVPGKYELAEKTKSTIKNIWNSDFKISKTTLDGFHSFQHWQIKMPRVQKM